MYKEFWQMYVKGYGHVRTALLISVVTLAVSLLEAVNIGLLVPLLETLASPEEEGGHWLTRAVRGLFDALGIPFGIETVLLVLGAVMLLMVGLKYLRMMIATKNMLGFQVWLRSTFMWHILHADMSYFHVERIGVQTDNLTQQTSRATGALQIVTEMAANLGIIIAYMTAAFIIAPLLTAIAFAMVLAISLLVQFQIRKAKVIGEISVVRENDFQAVSLESLTGISVVKSSLLERLKWKLSHTKAEETAEMSYRLIQNHNQMVALQEIALFGVVGGVVFVGISVLDLGLALVVALLFTLYRLMPRVNSLNSQRQALAGILPSLQAVKAMMDRAADIKIISGDKPFRSLEKGIQLDAVSFSYDGVTDVLKNTSFTIEKGQMTAIIGTSGAGKSTLVDMVLRYYDPVHGKIVVDGVDLRELDLTTWRDSIGVVSQDVFLFNDTIIDNIRLGRTEKTDEDIHEVAKQAFAHDFILQLPGGYETVVGDRGWNLSGGQRQRIALARAILDKPELLILDEATSSLDSESEQLVQEYIRSVHGSTTIIVVAHRMSTIHDADKIVVLQDGKIVEEGDWDSLLAGAGVFANYHRLQVEV